MTDPTNRMVRKTRRARVVTIAAVSAALALTAACGSSGNATNSAFPTAATSSAVMGGGVPGMSAGGQPSSAPAAAATITIKDYSYGAPITVRPGEKILIKNEDSVEHSVTADTGDAFSEDVDGGKTATITAPSKPGTYKFHCKYHPQMHGTLIVQG